MTGWNYRFQEENVECWRKEISENLLFKGRDICHLSACDSGDDSVKESRRGGDFKKKFMSIQVNESRINVAMVF